MIFVQGFQSISNLSVLEVSVQKSKIVLIGSFAVALSACSLSDKYANKDDATDDDEYVYVIDHEKVVQISRANFYSPSFVKTYWINYPKKRVKKSELEKTKQ